jgi:hypothetical protein
MTDSPPTAAAEQGPSPRRQGTPIAEAHLSHAEHDVIEAYRQAWKAWEEQGRPTTRRVDRFHIHQGVAATAHSSWGRRGSEVTVNDPTWLAARKAASALHPSFRKRLLRGDCILEGFREDTGQRSPVPLEVLPTAPVFDVGKALLKTAGGITYHALVVFERADYERIESAPSPRSAKPEPAAGKTAARQHRILVAAETIKGRQPEAWGAATKQAKADLVRTELQVSLKARGYSDDTIIRTLEKASLV